MESIRLKGFKGIKVGQENADEQQIDYVHVVNIKPSSLQPRKVFSQEELDDLALSIQDKGVLQPLIVRKLNGGYELVAGERRWRACKQIGLDKVPVIIRKLSDKEVSIIALIENLQREDLNPIEEAYAFQSLIEQYELTHQEVANQVGRSRTAVTNTIRLLTLGDSLKDMLASKKIEMGHARALLSLTPELQEIVACKVVEQQLSVRKTEQLVAQLNEPKEKAVYRAQNHIPKAILQSYGAKMSAVLTNKVNVSQDKTGQPKVTILLNDETDLAALVKRLSQLQ